MFSLSLSLSLPRTVRDSKLPLNLRFLLSLCFSFFILASARHSLQKCMVYIYVFGTQNVQGGWARLCVYSDICTAECMFSDGRAARRFVTHDSDRRAARLFMVHGLVGTCVRMDASTVLHRDTRIGCARAKLFMDD